MKFCNPALKNKRATMLLYSSLCCLQAFIIHLLLFLTKHNNLYKEALYNNINHPTGLCSRTFFLEINEL